MTALNQANLKSLSIPVRAIELVDPLADTLQRIAAQHREDPLGFVRNRELFGDLASEPAFTEPYLNALNSLDAKGARATLEALVTRSTPA
jgi:mannitol 2-dehydrogenase